jgi:hypothetical protein
MSPRAIWWTVLAALALAATLLVNYWGSYQPVSTVAYAGIVLALIGLVNLAIPFRFLGIRKRYIGALTLAAGVALAIVALHWPAPVYRVAHPRTQLDAFMPEYQFNERHFIRIHAPRQRVLQSIRDSTFRDMRSLSALLRVRGEFVRSHEAQKFPYDMRILDSFAKSGYVLGDSDSEILAVGGANVRAQRPLQLGSLQAFADYNEPGGIKIAFDFTVEDAGNGLCFVTAETRLLATDSETRRGVGRYWRLIVPGSGLLRLQWLDGIKRRAESATEPAT